MSENEDSNEIEQQIAQELEQKKRQKALKDFKKQVGGFWAIKAGLKPANLEVIKNRVEGWRKTAEDAVGSITDPNNDESMEIGREYENVLEELKAAEARFKGAETKAPEPKKPERVREELPRTEASDDREEREEKNKTDKKGQRRQREEQARFEEETGISPEETQEPAERKIEPPEITETKPATPTATQEVESFDRSRVRLLAMRDDDSSDYWREKFTKILEGLDAAIDHSLLNKARIEFIPIPPKAEEREDGTIVMNIRGGGGPEGIVSRISDILNRRKQAEKTQPPAEPIREPVPSEKPRGNKKENNQKPNGEYSSPEQEELERLMLDIYKVRESKTAIPDEQIKRFDELAEAVRKQIDKKERLTNGDQQILRTISNARRQIEIYNYQFKPQEVKPAVQPKIEAKPKIDKEPLKPKPEPKIDNKPNPQPRPENTEFRPNWNFRSHRLAFDEVAREFLERSRALGHIPPGTESISSDGYFLDREGRRLPTVERVGKKYLDLMYEEVGKRREKYQGRKAPATEPEVKGGPSSEPSLEPRPKVEPVGSIEPKKESEPNKGEPKKESKYKFADDEQRQDFIETYSNFFGRDYTHYTIIDPDGEVISPGNQNLEIYLSERAWKTVHEKIAENRQKLDELVRANSDRFIDLLKREHGTEIADHSIILPDGSVFRAGKDSERLRISETEFRRTAQQLERMMSLESVELPNDPEYSKIFFKALDKYLQGSGITADYHGLSDDGILLDKRGQRMTQKFASLPIEDLKRIYAEALAQYHAREEGDKKNLELDSKELRDLFKEKISNALDLPKGVKYTVMTPDGKVLIDGGEGAIPYPISRGRMPLVEQARKEARKEYVKKIRRSKADEPTQEKKLTERQFVTDAELEAQEEPGDVKALEVITREYLKDWREGLLENPNLNKEKVRERLGDRLYFLISGDMKRYLETLKDPNANPGNKNIREQFLKYNRVEDIKLALLKKYATTEERLKLLMGPAYFDLGFGKREKAEQEAKNIQFVNKELMRGGVTRLLEERIVGQGNIENLDVQGLGNNLDISMDFKYKGKKVSMRAVLGNTPGGAEVKEFYRGKGTQISNFRANVIEKILRKNIPKEIAAAIESQYNIKVKRVDIESGQLKVEYEPKKNE